MTRKSRARRKAMRDWIGERMRTIIRFLPVLAVALGLTLALERVPAARAQVTLDHSKITCEQYTGYKITHPQNLAMWVSGYCHGTRGNTTVDSQGLVANAKKLRDYCRRSPQA